MVLSKKYVLLVFIVKNCFVFICDDFGLLYKFDVELGIKVILISEMKIYMKIFYEFVLKFNIFYFEEKVKEKVWFYFDEKKIVFIKCGYIKEWKFGEVVLFIW